MINRRTLTKSLGAALAVSAVPGTATADTGRRRYLIRNGAVITVDPVLGVLPRADVLIDDGLIVAVGPDLRARGAQVVDATDMIVLPGFVNTHHHMWSALGRNFVADGFPYFAAKRATSTLYTADDVYRSVLLGLAELANAGVTTVHNWSNNTRTPAHADAELRAHRDGFLRARFSYGHVDQMPRDVPMDFTDVDRVRRQYFADGSYGLVHFGVALRGLSQSTEPAFFADMDAAVGRGLPVSIHAGQAPPRIVDAADYERRGWLGPKTLLCHYVTALDSDMEIVARTGTGFSWAPHSEFLLGAAGDPRSAFLRFRQAGVPVSLSSDATSIAPSDVFETMRLLPEAGFRDVLEMATLNGARALGLGDVTGSITVGKRADVILVRTNDINLAPGGLIETTAVQASTANVDTVFSDGRIIKRGGRLVHDVGRIIRDARASSLRIRREAGGILTP
ncbi:amidohydrolase family protein [Lentzea sp. JNUCC 0626]|uniref:amidohydrolase family protein n=1 Tax=Lentzea sp. JNUCC 0626 TaxID=3367513 RepID=UPI00374A7496